MAVKFSSKISIDVNGKMESIPANPLLKFNPTTLEDIRKCWNLDNGRMEQSLDILEDYKISFEVNGTMQSIPANPLLKFNPTTLEDVRKCWNLDNGRMEQSLDILEEWMSKQKHFTNKSFSREYLERTLVSCKGSVEKAKSQIDKLCTMKSLVPKFFISGDVKKNLGELAEI
ncbi:CRAL/TRIO domain-containing protein, partial [Operophtera brumata]